MNRAFEMRGQDWMLESRDWESISNFAPDGRFVNLINLRNNFDAPPAPPNLAGLLASTGLAGRDLDASMSHYLSLLDEEGEATIELVTGSRATPNRPADWTMFQQYAFRPAVDVNYEFDDPPHAFYQWVDTDGDGFFDARWFELVDATIPGEVFSLLPRDDTFRWFFAARAVDLSGLVNVNTAVDLRGGEGSLEGGGDDDYRVGSTPADIDLRRMLGLQDTSRLYEEDGYAGLVNGSGPANYSEYKANNPANTALAVGNAAEDARLEYFRTHRMPAPPPAPVPTAELSAEDRFIRYREDAAGVVPGESMFDTLGGGDGQYTKLPLFGLPSLLELLTYRGTNDDANTSPLERVFGGRDPNFDNFSPLRDNRPLLLERPHVELALLSGTAWKPAVRSLIWSAMDVRQNLTTHSGARPIRSSRLIFDGEIDSLLQVVSGIGARWESSGRPGDNFNFEGRYSAPELLQQASEGDPRDLFRAYAEALLPHTGEVDPEIPYWNATHAQYDRFKTLFYGHDPVRALIAAAHMTANATDMYDGGERDTVTAVTVVTSEDARRSSRLNDPDDYPAWSVQGPNGFPLRLVLDEGKLPEELLDDEVEAVNIFGIEAQPFIVEVNSYFMYSDVWWENGGDDDGGAWNPPAVQLAPFTIDGTIDFDNEDFIMQALAFQLTNPFDTPVHLWADGSRYYLEFGGHLFPLGRIEPQASNKVPENYGALVANAPGLADVILEPGITKVFYALSFRESHINDVRLERTDRRGLESYAIGDWINAQFGPDAIQIPVADSGTGELVKLVEGDGTDKDKVVLLWRALDLITSAGSGSGEGEAVRIDDLLVDRLRDPGTRGQSQATLDRSLPNGDTEVVDSAAYSERTAPRSEWGDNEGYSIVRSGTIRRKHGGVDVNTGSSARAERGEFPAWCIENKFDTSMNFSEAIGGRDTVLRKRDFDETSGVSGTATAGNFPMRRLFGDQTGVTPANRLFATQRREPWDKDGGVGINNAGTRYESIHAEIRLDNDKFSVGISPNDVPGQKLRAGDMLLPMGIGPMHIPTALPDPLLVGDQRWTTLGEMMALALGYDSVANPNPQRELKLHSDMSKTFDYGQLRLDTDRQVAPNKNAFVSFEDLDENGTWDPDEPVRGAGVPIAYNVLDVFTTTDPMFGSMRRPRIGVINANTASMDVMRAFPMLTPPFDTLGQPQWWWTGQGAPTRQSDVAAAVFAYIHKGVVPTLVGNADVVDFTNGGFFGDPDNRAREMTTGFAGIRETPGMRSLGELMAVRGGGVTVEHDIDHLARDFENIPMQGVESILYTDGAGRIADQLDDDYDEKLALINGMIGTASVRSDFFAVWFVVHGYQRDDVEGLSPDDPLVPTVAKRFLMVVDRSNVQRLGDKPRILMLQELPM